MGDMNVQHEMTLQKEEKKHERAKAKAAAYKENMTKTLAAMLKQASVKKVLAKDMMSATKTRDRDKIFDQAGAGTYDDDLEVITGNEDRPWED